MAILKKLFAAFKRRFSFRKRKKRVKKVKVRRRTRRKIFKVRRIKSRRIKRSRPKVRTQKKKKTPAKKAPSKKIKKKSPPVKRPPASKQENPPIGEITHYFSRIGVCVVKINSGTIAVGDKLAIRGATTKFIQPIRSLQIESVDVKVAHKNDLVGLKVDKKTRAGDKVYKVST